MAAGSALKVRTPSFKYAGMALTAATAVLSFSYLGSRTAPQDPLDATGTALSESVTLDGSAVSLWVYPGISVTVMLPPNDTLSPSICAFR